MQQKFIFLIIVVMLTMMPGPASAQFLEETGTLESLYESRARGVLNSFLRPHEYTVVVSAELNRDDSKLEEYREKMELQYLPGLPIPSDPTLVPATNDLHSMKNKVTIDLVLNADVPPEKESLIKMVLASKLHLNTESGDVINVARANLPDLNPPPESPQLLPELTWKMWGFIVVLSLIALAAIVFWFHRRSTAPKAAPHPDAERSPELSLNDPFAAQEAAREEDNKERAALADSAILEKELEDLKDQLLFLVSQYPQISSKTVSEMLESSEEDVIRVFEYLSWDLSRRIFSSVSPKIWSRLGNKVKTRTHTPTDTEYRDAIKNLYRSILARFLEAGADKDETNPFGFLFRLTPYERSRLMSNEPVSSFAMIALFADGDDSSTLIQTAKPELQEQILLEIAKLQALPESAVLSLANSLKERLKLIKASPSVFADGPALAAKILRSYSAERELEIYRKMCAEDPVSADGIRRVIAQFDDIAIYPQELVSSVLSLLDIDQLVKALFGLQVDVRTPVMSMMPPKRAKMIERDLERPGFIVATSECAANRRLFCLKLEEVLRSRGHTVSDVWKEIDSRSGQSQHLKLAS